MLGGREFKSILRLTRNLLSLSRGLYKSYITSPGDSTAATLSFSATHPIALATDRCMAVLYGGAPVPPQSPTTRRLTTAGVEGLCGWRIWMMDGVAMSLCTFEGGILW